MTSQTIPHPNYFSILHLNIKKKKHRKFQIIFKLVICFSETWLDDLTLGGNASYGMPNCTRKHQVQGDRKGGGVSIYIHSSLNFKIRPDLSITNNDIESVSAEIVSDKIRNTIVNVSYRPPNGQIDSFETFLNNTFSQIKVSTKAFHNAGDFNLNLLNHDTNKKMQNFLNLVYQSGMIPTN